MDLDLSGIPILVVDDDETTRTLIVKILQRIGFKDISQAADGQEAMDLVSVMVPAVVICDLHMKPVDGLSFLAHLRYSDVPALKGLPVVMLTSDMRDEAIEMAAKLKATEYIVKPAGRIEVLSAIQKALGVELA